MKFPFSILGDKSLARESMFQSKLDWSGSQRLAVEQSQKRRISAQHKTSLFWVSESQIHVVRLGIKIIWREGSKGPVEMVVPKIVEGQFRNCSFRNSLKSHVLEFNVCWIEILRRQFFHKCNHLKKTKFLLGLTLISKSMKKNFKWLKSNQATFLKHLWSWA